MMTRLWLVMLLTAGFAIASTSNSLAQLQAMPKSVQDQIVKLAAAPGTAESCVITSLFPAYYGPLPGASGELAVGLLDLDPENCGGVAPPQTSVVSYLVTNSHYRKITLPSELAAMQVGKILAVMPQQGGFRITVLFRGPHDPMCCANQKTSLLVKISE